MRTKIFIVAGMVATVLIGFMVPAQAQPRKIMLAVTTHATTSTVTKTDSGAVPGYIDDIWIDMDSGTANITVASTESGVTLVSKTAMSADTTIRPRFVATETDGSATATTNGEWRYNAYGETIVFTVANANTTNVSWKCWIKYDDGK